MLRRFGDGNKTRSAEAARPSVTGVADATFGPEEGETMDRDRPRDSTGTPTSTELNALLGKGSEFDGKLAFEGTVRIDGTFTGEIATSDTLIVGEGAKVQAEVTCGTIVVHGEVTGNIRASQAVELHKPARVRGDIASPSLVVERGVVFEGHSKMEDLETSKIVPMPGSASKAE